MFFGRRNMLTRDDLLRAVQVVAGKVGGDLTVRDFQEATGISPSKIDRLWGSWTKLRLSAGLSARGKAKAIYSDEELFEELSRVGEVCGRFPTCMAFNRHSARSWPTLESRFGTRVEVWQAYWGWLQGRPVEARPGYLRGLPAEVKPADVPGLLRAGSGREGMVDFESEFWAGILEPGRTGRERGGQGAGADGAGRRGPYAEFEEAGFRFGDEDPAEVLADWEETGRRLRELGGSGLSSRPTPTPGAPAASAVAGEGDPRAESGAESASGASVATDDSVPAAASPAPPKPKPAPITPKDWSRFKRGLY